MKAFRYVARWGPRQGRTRHRHPRTDFALGRERRRRATREGAARRRVGLLLLRGLLPAGLAALGGLRRARRAGRRPRLVRARRLLRGRGRHGARRHGRGTRGRRGRGEARLVLGAARAPTAGLLLRGPLPPLGRVGERPPGALPRGAGLRGGLLRLAAGLGQGLGRVLEVRLGECGGDGAVVRAEVDLRGGAVVVVVPATRLRAAETARDRAERRGELGGDDEELARVLVRQLRKHLEVLVGEQLRVGLAAVDGVEDLEDRAGLTLGPEDRGLGLALRAEDRRS